MSSLILYDIIIERDKDNVLDEDTRRNMAVSLATFVESAIDKFISGQKEHGGKLQDRDCALEARKEFLDLFWYHAAQDWE